MKTEIDIENKLLKKDKKILDRAKRVVKTNKEDKFVKYKEYQYLYNKFQKLIGQFYYIFEISDTYQDELLKTREKLQKEIAEKSEIENKLKVKIEELKNMSTRDQLTGLYNRREFESVINDEWRHAVRETEPISLIMIDIDNFKAFNDNYGHLAGDNCLQKISRVMESSLKRPRDFLARFGGEEFVVILPETGQEGAKHTAERIRKKVYEAEIPHQYSNVKNYITISLGVASTEDPDLFLFEEILDEADQALYESKESGKNKVCIRSLKFD